MFGLRVFQECSDIYQEADGQRRKIGGVFPQDTYASPDYPGLRRLRDGGGPAGEKS